MKRFFVMLAFAWVCVGACVCLTACGGDSDDDAVVAGDGKGMVADDLVGKWYGVYFQKEDKSDAVNAMLQIEKGGKYKMFVEADFGNYAQVEDGTFVMTAVSDGWYQVKFHSEMGFGGVTTTRNWTITVKWSDGKHNSIDVLYGDKWVKK